MSETSAATATSEQAAGADFRSLAQRHYENFPVGSWLVPEPQRTDLRRVYAFARTADDLADEYRDAAALTRLRSQLKLHLEGAADDLLLVDLCKTVRDRELPAQLLFDLLDAFDSDLQVRRYDEASLLAYCRKSADPVGRIVLRLFGQNTPERDRWSDSICTGLQMLNHLQDVREDLLERDRIYLPTDDLLRFGVDEEDLRASGASTKVRELIRYWADRVATMFREGWPLVGSVAGRLRLELRAILHGAAAVLSRLRAIDHDVLAEHVRLSKPRRLGIVFSALLSSRMPKAFQ